MRKLWVILTVLFLPALAGATVSGTASTVAFTCTNSTGPFPFTFPVLNTGALQVIDQAAGALPGVMTVLASNQWTATPVNGSYANGGSVTLVTACATGDTLTIARTTETTQLTAFTPFMPALYANFENRLDQLSTGAQDTYRLSQVHLGNVTGSGVASVLTTPLGQYLNLAFPDGSGCAATGPVNAILTTITTGCAGSGATADVPGNIVAPLSVRSPKFNFGIFVSQFASVAAADASGALCGGNCVVKLDNNFSLTGNTTLASKWDMTGGGIITRGTNTLTLSKPVVAGKGPWLDAAGTGIVNFAAGQGSADWTWWGVKADSGVTDNTNAINQAAASAAASNIALHMSGGGSGYVGVTGQLVFNGVPSVMGDGTTGANETVIGTTYTAGCGVVASNMSYGTVSGFVLTYEVSTVGVTTASGFCPQTMRRGSLRDVRVIGAYKALDTSIGTGTGLFQEDVSDFWAISPTGYGLYLAAPTNGTISSNTFRNVRVDCSITPTQAVIYQVFLGTAGSNKFDTMNLQNCLGGGIFQGADVADTTYQNNHWEANTPTASGTSTDGFLQARGAHTTIISGLDWVANFVNTANISAGHYSLFLAQTGQAVFKIDHVWSFQNQLTGVTMPLCEFVETSGMGPGKCSFGTGSIDNQDGTLIVGAQANFAAPTFSTYVDQTTPSGLLNPEGGALAIGDANAVYYCPQNDRRTYLYNTTLTANRTLTLEVPYAFSGCKLLVSIPSGLGTTFHVTVQDSLSNVLATMVSGQSATFVVAPTTVTGTAPITAFLVAGAAPPGGAFSSIATFTSAVKLNVGQSVTISGLAVGTYLNGLTGTVQAAALDGAHFSLQFPSCSTNCNVGLTTDAGTATFTNGGAWQLAQFGALTASTGWMLGLPAAATVAASSVYFGLLTPPVTSAVTLNAATLTLSTIPLTCSTFPVISLCSGTVSSTCFANVTLDGTHSTYAMTVATPLVPAGTSLRMFITTPAVGCGTNAVTIGAVAFGQ